MYEWIGERDSWRCSVPVAAGVIQVPAHHSVLSNCMVPTRNHMVPTLGCYYLSNECMWIILVSDKRQSVPCLRYVLACINSGTLVTFYTNFETGLLIHT